MHIPIKFENEENAWLISDGTNFTIEAHLATVYNPKQWIDDAGYGICHRTGISLEELIQFLPAISEYIKENIRIESETHALSNRHNTSIDSNELYCTTYKVYVRERCVFNQNTLKDASLYELRSRVVTYIARLVYDYNIFMETTNENII